MPTIEAKDKLVAVKAFARSNPLPLDSTSIYDSLEAAETYASAPNAYGGQVISVLVDGVYKNYTLQPSGTGGLKLEDSSSQVLEWGTI